MDYTELLFASAIITRSAKLRSNRKADFFEANPDADVSEWTKENPDTKFVLDALKEAQDVAEFIRKQHN